MDMVELREQTDSRALVFAVRCTRREPGFDAFPGACPFRECCRVVSLSGTEEGLAKLVETAFFNERPSFDRKWVSGSAPPPSAWF